MHLIVHKYNKLFKVHECDTLDGERLFVDLEIDDPKKPRDFYVGKTIEVWNLDPFIFIASNIEVLNNEPIKAEQ